MLLATALPVNALPEDGQVAVGSATIDTSAPGRLDIRQHSEKAIIDWRSFSIQANEQANFRQPSAESMTLNRVTGSMPSEIFGSLTANGRILLINPTASFSVKAPVSTWPVCWLPRRIYPMMIS